MATNYGTVEALAPSYDEADALVQAAYGELGSAAAGVVEQIGTAVDNTSEQAAQEMLTTVPNDMDMTGGEMTELMDGYNDVIGAISGEMALLAQSTANQIQVMQANYENLLGGMREGLPYLEQHIDQQMASVAAAGYSPSADVEDDLPDEDPVDVVNPFEFPEGSDEYGWLTEAFSDPEFAEMFGSPNPNSIYDVNMMFGDSIGLPKALVNGDGLHDQRVANFEILKKLFGWPSEEGVDNYASKDLMSPSGQAYYRFFQFAIAEGYDPDTAINIADTMIARTGVGALPDRSDQSIKTILKWTTIQNSPAAANFMNEVPNITTSSTAWDPEFITGLNVLGAVTGTPTDPNALPALPETGGGTTPGHAGLANQFPDDPTEPSSADAGMFSGVSPANNQQVQSDAMSWQRQQNDPIFNYQSFDADNMWNRREAEARNATMLREQQKRLQEQQKRKAEQSRIDLMNPTDTQYYDALGAWASSLGL